MLYKTWPIIAATLFSCFFFFAQAQAQSADDAAIRNSPSKALPEKARIIEDAGQDAL
jgi:hypothetical protein